MNSNNNNSELTILKSKVASRIHTKDDIIRLKQLIRNNASRKRSLATELVKDNLDGGISHGFRSENIGRYNNNNN